MSFLAPLFLAGALAVALPVVFHLIRRTSKEQVTFSSLMFLMPSPPRLTRRSRLENIFLLLLRCVVLCLLAAAFARPFFQKPATADRQSGPEKSIVILLDTSASMRRGDLWPTARARAEAILKKASPADRISLFTFDRHTRQWVSFEQWAAMGADERVALTSKRLAELSPGWSGTRLGNALITAADAFAELDRQQQPGGLRQIVLLSDLQEGSRLDGLQGYQWPRGIQLLVEPLKTKRTTNAGLQPVQDQDEFNKAPADAGMRLRVSNSADSKREQFQLRWDGDAESPAVEVYVPPGQSRVVPAPKLAAGVAGERLVLAGDDENFDNSIYLVPPKAERVQILHLGNDSETDSAQSLYYLKRAFPETRRQVVQILARPGETPLPAADLAGAHLIIITDALPASRLKSVQHFLSEGKTVLFALQAASDAPALGRLAGVENFSAEEAAGSRYAMLGQIDFEHPLFAPFADPRYSDFTKVHFWKHRRLDADKLPGARVLARFDDGDAALLQIPVGQGSVLALTAGWRPADSQLALSSKFVPLLFSILEQSGGLKTQPSQYVVGDDVPLPGTAAARPLTVRKPDGALVELAAGASRFSQTDLPGIYTVTSLEPPLRFAVNLEAAESKTAPLAEDELEHLGVPLHAPPVEAAKQLEQRRERLQATELENRQKLWRWLIAGALMLLVMETWLAGWLNRRRAIPMAAQT